MTSASNEIFPFTQKSFN